MTRKVGYGSTPEYTRFQKGKSGNPRGRPKGRATFLADLATELGQIVQITEGGQTKRITKQRALLKSLVTSAIKGDVAAARLITSWAGSVADDPAKLGAPLPLEPSDLKLLASFLKRQSPAQDTE